jgi:PncC family amidohydrolase
MSTPHAPEPLEVRIYRLMPARRLTFAAAESCTGGLITHRLTNVPGSSAYVIGGIVAYANEAKIRLLNVQEETLKQYGAVSEQVVRHVFTGDRDENKLASAGAALQLLFDYLAATG